MSFADNVALFQQRFLANFPQATADDASVFMQIAKAFLAADADTQYMIQQATQNMYVSTATGAFLDARAADYGIGRNMGAYATSAVVFHIPAPVSTTIDIPAGTLVGTAGNGITNPPITFTTSSDATITIGATTSGGTPVPVVAEQTGIAGNVATNAITVVLSFVGDGGVSVINDTVPGTGGLNADTDAQLRSKISAFLVARFNTASVEAAVEALNGVFDCHTHDNGDGTITVYWCDATGSVTAIAGLGTSVRQAIYNVIPTGILPDTSHVLISAFTVKTFDKITVNYSAPSTSLTSELTPLVAAAVTSYMAGLVHNEIPTQFGISQYVNAACGGRLTNCYVLDDSLTHTSPSIATLSASSSQIWKPDPAGIYTTTTAPWVIVVNRV